MTTIAAFGLIMAADGALNRDEEEPVLYSPKLLRVGNAIIGTAGYGVDCQAFMEWFKHRRTKRPQIKYKFEALALHKNGKLYHYDHTGVPDRISGGMCAIGSGREYAFGAMDFALKMGMEPDPRLAIEVAEKRDSNTKLPIAWLCWRRGV